MADISQQRAAKQRGLSGLRSTHGPRQAKARYHGVRRFEALEPPVPLRTGGPPYPKAHHFDQTGHVTGMITLDNEPIAVDCFAMRDRSWGPRPERGYRRVG